MYYVFLVCKYEYVCLAERAQLKINGDVTKKTQRRDFL